MSSAACLDGVESIYPLTPMQEGMLVAALAAPGSGMGFQQLSATVAEPLNGQAFVEAWQALIDRHSIFRTGFVWSGLKQPVQVVQRRAAIPIALEDWRGKNPVQVEHALETFLAADAKRGFNLTRPPLARVLVAHATDSSFIFVWTYHHLLLDGWSLTQSLKEVFVTYRERCAGRSVPPVQSRQFRDYVAWMRQCPTDAATHFWREALAGFERPNRMVFDAGLARGRAGPNDSAVAEKTLDAALAARVLSGTRRMQLTFGTLVYGAWALVLARVAEATDVLFATTVAGRPPSLSNGTEIVGLFINNVPVRVRLEEDSSVPDWLRCLQQGRARAHEFEHVPMSLIKGVSSVGVRDALATSIVVVENYPVDGLLREMASSTRLRSVRGSVRTAYPLTLVALSYGESVRIQIAHDRRRISHKAAEWTLERFVETIVALATEPEARVAQLLGRIPPVPQALRPVEEHAPAAVGVASRDEFERRVVSAVEDLTGVTNIGLGRDLLELCGSSLGLVAVVARIGERFEQVVSIADLVSDPSVGRLAALLRGKAVPWSPLVPIQVAGSGRPLYCVHPSGGGILCYGPLARALGSKRPFIGIQARGFDDEAACDVREGIEDLATVYLTAVRAGQPTGPYLLAGWSMGGSVAYEMARQLRQAGERVAFLGLVDTRPRESFNLSGGEHEDRPRLLSAFLWITALAMGLPAPPGLASLAASRGDIAAIATALNDAGVFPASIHPDQAERYFRLWQGHVRALHDYWPGAIDCPVTLFRASEPPPKELAELLRLDPDRDRMVDDWRGRCRVGLRTIDVPGNHYTVVSQQHVQALAHAIGSTLEDANIG